MDSVGNFRSKCIKLVKFHRKITRLGCVMDNMGMERKKKERRKKSKRKEKKGKKKKKTKKKKKKKRRGKKRKTIYMGMKDDEF